MDKKVLRVEFPNERTVELPYPVIWDSELTDNQKFFDITIQLIIKLKEELDCVKSKIE